MFRPGPKIKCNDIEIKQLYENMPIYLKMKNGSKYVMNKTALNTKNVL